MRKAARIAVRLVGMLAIGAVCTTSASNGNPEVRVRVQDSKGGTISKAFVVMHREASEDGGEVAEGQRQDEVIPMRFDGTADFVVTVKPGIYDVYVSSFGYDPKCMKINVAYGNDRALVFQLAPNKWIYNPVVE